MAKTKMQCPVGRAMKSAGFKTPQQSERNMGSRGSFHSPQRAERRMKKRRR